MVPAASPVALAERSDRQMNRIRVLSSLMMHSWYTLWSVWTRARPVTEEGGHGGRREGYSPHLSGSNKAHLELRRE